MRPGLPVLALTLCAVLAPAQDVRVIERSGEHFRIVSRLGGLRPDVARALAGMALAQLDSCWATMHEQLGVRGSNVHSITLYYEEADYRAAEKESSPFGFELEGFVAADGVGHVPLWPVLPADLLLTVGLPQSTVENLLRVGAEQVVTPLVPDTDVDGWTKWVLVMGMVEAVTNPEHAPGVDAAHDNRRVPVFEALGDGEAISLASLLETPLTFRDRSGWEHAMSRSALLASIST